MISNNGSCSDKPIAVVGAGDLISHVFRNNDESNEVEYRFGILRLEDDLKVTHSIRPCDLRDIVKLCQVLAITILDDGWLDRNQNQVIEELLQSLDEITRRWSETAHG